MVEGGQIGVYRVLKRIGEGGMGSVWLAEHSMLGRRAAIKVLHHEFSTKPEIVTRFFNEARAATAIADPGIVQIFDFGHNTDGSAYIVMELLDGEPLDQRLARVGALGVPEALRIMRQVSSTLGAAHARGIVHRDLKPENIFMVRDPEVAGGERAKVLDFGIAKLSADQGGVKTQTSAVMGTPAYMSPEQCRGAGQVDQRSDVYALGCVLFRLLCGRPPFDAEGVGELIVMHLREQPPALGSLRPGIPPEVEQLVQRCLAKDPAHRFSSGSELAIALGALTGSSPHVPTPSAVYSTASAPTTLSSAVGASTSPGSTQVPAKKSRGAVLAGIGIAVAGAAFAVVFMSTRGSGEKAAAAPETSEAPNPEAAKANPEAAKPEAAKPEAAKPEAAKPEAAKPEAAKSETPEQADPAADLTARTTAVLERFTAWARDHAGAPCPDAAALGGEPNDPWGHPFRITCTDQPSDQIIGAISAGPDGTPGNGDDVASWSLGPQTTALVRGPRWTVAMKDPTTRTSTTAKKKTQKSSTKRPGGNTSGVELDENGLPIAR